MTLAAFERQLDFANIFSYLKRHRRPDTKSQSGFPIRDKVKIGLRRNEMRGSFSLNSYARRVITTRDNNSIYTIFEEENTNLCEEHYTKLGLLTESSDQTRPAFAWRPRKRAEWKSLWANFCNFRISCSCDTKKKRDNERTNERTITKLKPSEEKPKLNSTFFSRWKIFFDLTRKCIKVAAILYQGRFGIVAALASVSEQKEAENFFWRFVASWSKSRRCINWVFFTTIQFGLCRSRRDAQSKAQCG